MFNLVDVGERAGSGIPNIFSVWKKQGWSAPEIEESFEPERIMLSLRIKESGDKKSALKTEVNKMTIIEYVTENVTAKTKEIAALLGIKEARTRRLLSEMIEEGVIVAEGANKNRVYRLK